MSWTHCDKWGSTNLSSNSSTNRSTPEISFQRSPWSWRCGTVCGSAVEVVGSPVRRPRGAIRPPGATRGGRSPGRRSATPRRSRTRRLGTPLTWSTRAWRSAPKVVEKQQALGRELTGVAQGVGVGPEAERSEFFVAPERPGLAHQADDVGPQLRVARAAPSSGSGGPTTGSRRPSWWRTWPRRRRWPCCRRRGRGRAPGRRARLPTTPGPTPVPPTAGTATPARATASLTAVDEHLELEPGRRRASAGPSRPSARTTTWRWTRPRRWNSTTFM